MLTRKRRRSEAFPQDELEDYGNINSSSPRATEAGTDAEDGAGNANSDARLAKEREIWEEFREEHFQIIEQLPLTLQRQYSLMHELDQQAQDYLSELLPLIVKYVNTRRKLVSQETVAPSPAPDEPAEALNGSTPECVATPRQSTNGHSHHLPPSALPPLYTPRRTPSGVSTPRTPSAIPPHPKRLEMPQTTREMLTHIAWMSDELIHTSQEKLNIAQTAQDSVERHLRMIDLAIKEQKDSIALGVRAGTQVALPDVPPPPRVGRQTRIVMSPDLEGDDFLPDLPPSQLEEDALLEAAEAHSKRKKSQKKKRSTGTATDATPALPSLKITLPALAPASPIPRPDEELFCVCNQVSYGDMVGCDDSECQKEWFHLGCVGLSRPPPKNRQWYCPECRIKRRNRKRQ